MTYEEAARIITKFIKNRIQKPALIEALQMGADALFKRAAAEKAISYSEQAILYSEDNPDGELIDISNNAPMAE